MLTTKSFKLFTIWTAAITFILIIIGGVVRTTGSGDACPDWPLCHGSIIPPFELSIWIEWTHRLTTTLVSASILILTVWATLRYRRQKVILIGAWLAPLLLAVQIVLGGLVVRYGLPPALVGIHLANALLILATLITVSIDAHRPWEHMPARSDPPLRRLILWSTVAVYALIFTGTVVTGSGSVAACLGWPLCNDDVLPKDIFQGINLTHRYFAAAVGVLLFYVLSDTLRRHRANGVLRRAAHSAIGLFILQILIGGINVLTGFQPALGTLHVAVASAVFGAMVAFAVIGWHSLGPQGTPAGVAPAPDAPPASPARTPLASAVAAPAAPPARPPLASTSAAADQTTNLTTSLRLGREANQPRTWRTVGRDYLLLTKPFIVLLLVTTTLCAMLIAAHGLPPLPVLILTLIGGAFAAGGANALNSWYDRDLDKLMDRTARRPIPSGRVPARAALAFALTLCTLSVLILGLFVNWLSALLALTGIIYYSYFYTVVLKYLTPQNIVVGGGAGAIPPLVGWAAVTGDLSLLSLYLFAIILLWTPPHTWALMLLIEKDYAKAKVPMMPVVWGDNEARWQSLLYSILLFFITLIPFTVDETGILYFVAAFILGAWFLYLAWSLWRRADKVTARRLYKYSNYYLFLLFFAMVIDAVLMVR